ncbi:e3e54035-b881-4713-b636-979b6256acb3 [Thermothielavioides terrestris]|uniref:E3e54035-b881-4713-b636-979b6256acb3 n=1 Tax=Thermothielavioides terrestris TaxID=2587410 RepID=A0A446BUI3_9PEZI|nr:e3e54035-b881-4713-b636-979b6256acb3 [Thermothielavioides terrestris]
MGKGKEKPIFRGLTIAAAGDLGGGQWTDANIARWVGLREGSFVRDMSEAVTHVVCSADEFKRRGSIVKEALKRLNTCEIVTLDWLEDSMHKRKRLPEDPYSHVQALKRERERERRRLAVLKGLEKAVREVNPYLYHLYRDYTFFEYQVLHESNNPKPHLYWFVARFYKKKGDPQPKVHRPSHAPGIFAREFALFESFFQIKTGIPWEQRLIKAGTTSKSFFQYQPPTGGKPVGWVPKQYLPAEVPNSAATKPDVPPQVPADNKNSTETSNLESASQTPKARQICDSHPQQLVTPAPSPQADLAITAGDRALVMIDLTDAD